jgi:hypothetical protein
VNLANASWQAIVRMMRDVRQALFSHVDRLIPDV